MLNKELLRFRRQRNQLLVQFVNVNDNALQSLAAEFINIYAIGLENKLTNGTLQEMAESVISGALDRKLATGLNKIICDKLEFGAPGQGINFCSGRAELFARSGELLKQDISPELYRKELDERCEKLGMPKSDIYQDLPENEILLSYEPFSPRELLNRYNMVLVQSLVLYAERLHIEINSPKASEMRQFFRYLKFFRLLPESVDLNEEQGVYKFELGGALSIFEGVKRYALNLAAIIPAVCKFSTYKIVADLKIDNRALTLKVDQRDNLLSHYRNSGNYVPEEIEIFMNLFNEKADSWRIVSPEESPWCRLPDGRFIFPDMTFSDKAGRLIHFEVFHAWHSGPLCERLDYMLDNPDYPLLIGIERSAKLSESWLHRVENDPDLKRRVIRFRNFPGVDRVLKLLEKF